MCYTYSMKEWKLRERLSENLEEQLLLSRGVELKDAENFFNHDYARDIGDPFKMLNMDKAVERISAAIKNTEKIVLFGDYDADGVCGATVFYDFFKKIGFENFEIYIPDRHKEGYGLTLGALEEFKNKKINLIITIDCGVRDYSEIDKAKEYGIDTVVLDHHLPSADLPRACAIVDPKLTGDTSFKELCGAAVAFQTVRALILKSFPVVPADWSKWLLDAVAVATIADMVPLKNENRALVFYGLEVLKKTRRIGLLLLLEKLKIKKSEITEDDLAYMVAPKINTASRMDHATTSFNLLTTEKLEEAKWLVSRIIEKNSEQKELVSQIFKEASDFLDGQYKGEFPEILILGDEKWPPGILGLLANKILEKTNRPVFLWGKGEAVNIKGSARSNGSVNLTALLEKLPADDFIDRGGHAMAAGFTLKPDKIEAFEKHLKEEYGKSAGRDLVENVLWIDAEINLDQVNWDFCRAIQKFKPFGMGNDKPIFALRGLKAVNIKSFGNGGIHLQLDFQKTDREIIPAIGFFMQKYNFNLDKNSELDLAVSVEVSSFKGYNELRLRIIDIKLNNT